MGWKSRLIPDLSASLHFDTMPWGPAGLSARRYSGDRRTGSREEEGEWAGYDHRGYY